MTKTRQITERYLLAISIPFHKDDAGNIYLDPLWHHDLLAHLNHFPNFILLAPCRARLPGGTGLISWQTPAGCSMRFVAMPDPRTTIAALTSLPRGMALAWRAIGQAEIVHSGVAGWPLPIGMIVNPLAKLRRKPLVIVVESAFWRIQPGQKTSMRARMRSRMMEAFARWSLRQAHLGIYTTTGYQDSLPVRPGRLGAVVPASWIGDEDVISPQTAITNWAEKTETPRFILPSRLEPEKGIETFLAAVSLLEKAGRSVQIDVIGSGSMAAAVQDLATACRHVRLRLLSPVPYGAPFMDLLRDYHAVIVPTHGDEQPRILYDAFSQAVPVIATATRGNLDVVSPDVTGHIVAERHARALGNAIFDLSLRPDRLREMGLAALQVAQDHTHSAMHEKRANLSRTMLDQYRR